MFHWLLPITGYSFFDVWTLPHLAFWVFMGSSLWGLKVNKWVALFSCLLFAFGWEVFEELVAFRLWPDRWLDPESWWNSWISDPLTCVIGVLGIWYLLDNRPRR
jgi:hypothetical protein